MKRQIALQSEAVSLSTAIMFVKHCIISLVLAIFLSLKIASAGLVQSKPQCQQPVNFYGNLGCKPRGGKTDACPNCFDCTHIDPNINKCYYQGKYYDIGQTVDADKMLPSCYDTCKCTAELKFECTYNYMNCNWMPLPSDRNDCYYTFGANQCCPTGYKCPTKDTLKCKAPGYTVYEGQTFTNPKDSCSVCECTRGVTGNDNDAHCRKYGCDIELYQSNSILGYCAAVYWSSGDCCPYDYTCPHADDVFESGASTKQACDDKKPCNQCRYGDDCYDIGTKFTRTESYTYWEDYVWFDITHCECLIPPYFTCFKEYR